MFLDDANVDCKALSETLKADHGFNMESRTIRDFIHVISNYEVSKRRDVLQFLTGSPKLPIGGEFSMMCVAVNFA
jgi:E3 ubiquitin-protein ligase TRIP12